MIALTLAQLEAGGPGTRPNGAGNSLYTCPLCGKPRKLSLHVETGLWKCWRCGEAGKIGFGNGQGAYKPPELPPPKPEVPWPEILAKANPVPIRGSPGAEYLKRRGIPVELAEACGVRWSRAYRGRAAVLFDIRDANGEMVAFQGRFLDGAKPKMMTAGPKSNGLFQTPGALQSCFAICEAPIDALSILLLWGIPSVATCGTGPLPLCALNAARGKTVMVAADNDEAGARFLEQWSEQLRRARAKPVPLVAMHAKDWNAELMLSKGKP